MKTFTADSSTTSQTPVQSTAGSLFVFGLAFLSVLGAIGLGACSAPMFSREVEFGGMVFFFDALVLGLATLLCVTLPSWLGLRRRPERRYRLCLRLSWLTLALIILECAALVLFGH
jgi:hypothetical protein